MRKNDLTEIWYDRASNLLWSDRLPLKMDYKTAKDACPSLNAEFNGSDLINWRLPTAQDYSTNPGLIQVLPNMPGNWFWTATTKGRLVMIYTGSTGELSYNPFSGMGSGSVRCVSKY